MKIFYSLLIIFFISFSFINIAFADNTHYSVFDDDSDQYGSRADDGVDGDTDLAGGDFTFEAMLYMTDTTNADVFGKWLASGDNRSYYFTQQSGQWTLKVCAEGTCGTAASFDFAWTELANTWYRVSVVYDSTNASSTLYIDGVLQSSLDDGDDGTTAFDGTADFTVGYAGGATSGTYFDGRMDDIRFFDDQRTLTEINDYKDCFASTTWENLIINYKMDNDLLDSAGSNDLTNNNSVTFDNADLPFTEGCDEPEEQEETATSTVSSSTVPYNNDMTMIVGYTEIYNTSTTTPDEIRYHYFHIPFFLYIIFALPIFWIGNRLILEWVVRLRRNKS